MAEIDVQCRLSLSMATCQENLSGKTCSSMRAHTGRSCAKSMNMPQSLQHCSSGSVQPQSRQIETKGSQATFVFTVLLKGGLNQMMFLRCLKCRHYLSITLSTNIFLQKINSTRSSIIIL